VVHWPIGALCGCNFGVFGEISESRSKQFYMTGSNAAATAFSSYDSDGGRRFSLTILGVNVFNELTDGISDSGSLVS